MLTYEQSNLLKAPFSAADHMLLKGKVYIREDAITNRLDEVDPSWAMDVNSIVWRTASDGTEYCTAHVTLTVCGVKRDGIGQHTQDIGKSGAAYGEPDKSAVTDALKRAARLFGIGRYMLQAPKEMSEAQLIKWVRSLDDGSTTENQPAQQPAPTAPQLDGFNLEWVTRSLTKQGKTYYRFNDTDTALGSVYTFTRAPFRDAGLDVQTWDEMELDVRYDMRPFNAIGYATKKGEGRFELVSVEVSRD